MDVEKLWQNSSGNDQMLNDLLKQGNFHHLQSRLPLKKLRKNLIIGLAWAIIITLLYLSLFFSLHMWQAYVTLPVLIFFNLTIMVDTWQLYKKTPATITPSHSLKEELTIHHNSFEKWWSLQQRISLFVYPIAITGGFIIGGIIGSGKAMETFLFNAKMLGILSITILIMVPLCYLGARWMFNYAYGKHLRKLKAIIEELSESQCR